MKVMFLLIGCSFLIALSFLALFLWAVRKGQYEDTYTPSVRMLFEDGTLDKKESEKAKPADDNTKLNNNFQGEIPSE